MRTIKYFISSRVFVHKIVRYYVQTPFPTDSAPINTCNNRHTGSEMSWRDERRLEFQSELWSLELVNCEIL